MNKPKMKRRERKEMKREDITLPRSICHSVTIEGKRSSAEGAHAITSSKHKVIIV